MCSLATTSKTICVIYPQVTARPADRAWLEGLAAAAARSCSLCQHHGLLPVLDLRLLQVAATYTGWTKSRQKVV